MTSLVGKQIITVHILPNISRSKGNSPNKKESKKWGVKYKSPQLLRLLIFLSPLKTLKKKILPEILPKILNPQGTLCRGCFSKLRPPICGVNFSENILMPQVRVHMKENWNDTKFLLRLTLKKNSLLLYFYRLLRALSPTIVGKNVQIYGIQITGMNLSVKYFLCPVSSNYLTSTVILKICFQTAERGEICDYTTANSDHKMFISQL